MTFTSFCTTLVDLINMSHDHYIELSGHDLTRRVRVKRGNGIAEKRKRNCKKKGKRRKSGKKGKRRKAEKRVKSEKAEKRVKDGKKSKTRIKCYFKLYYLHNYNSIPTGKCSTFRLSPILN